VGGGGGGVIEAVDVCEKGFHLVTPQAAFAALSTYEPLHPTVTTCAPRDCKVFCIDEFFRVNRMLSQRRWVAGVRTVT
jgi:hypothetical protein